MAEGKKIDIAEYCKQYPEHRTTLLSKFRTAEFLKRDFQDEDFNGRKLGDYIILQEIGRGGMGVVFLGIHPSLSRLSAIKVLPPSFVYDKEALKNFQEEAKTIAKFSHPNIVPIYSISEEKGVYYIAMGFISGPSLRNLIEKLKKNKQPHLLKATAIRELLQNSPIEKQDISQRHITLKRDLKFWNKSYFQFVATISKEIANALSYAHQNGIYHGDLKPSNILLTNEATPLIVDFGLSKDIKKLSLSNRNDGKEFTGTLAYAAPEQVKENVINDKTDIWSLGATLYELLTFKNPFIESTIRKTTDKILKSYPLPLRAHNKKIPIELEAIVLKCLEKSPQNRYDSINNLAGDLNNYLESRPIKAKPDWMLKKIKKAIIRKPVRAILVFSLFIVSIIASLAGGNYLLNKTYSDAVSLLKQDKLQEALANYNVIFKAGRFFPQTKPLVLSSLYDIGLYYSSKQNEQDKAILCFNKLIAEDITNVYSFHERAYHHLSLGYYLNKELSKAVDAYKKSYALKSYLLPDDFLPLQLIFSDLGIKMSNPEEMVDFLSRTGFSDEQITKLTDRLRYFRFDLTSEESKQFQKLQETVKKRINKN